LDLEGGNRDPMSSVRNGESGCHVEDGSDGIIIADRDRGRRTIDGIEGSVRLLLAVEADADILN
jgi:hypothetical protein